MEKKLEVIVVPQDKCPLDIIADLGTRTLDSWIFLHDSAVKRLEETVDLEKTFKRRRTFLWEETDKYPSTYLEFDTGEVWNDVIKIEADDIAFKTKSSDPEVIFFLIMSE